MIVVSVVVLGVVVVVKDAVASCCLGRGVKTTGFWVKITGFEVRSSAAAGLTVTISRSGNLKGLTRGPVRNTLSGRLLKQ